MKWLLLVIVMNLAHPDFRVSVEQTIEIETEALCKTAIKALEELFKSTNKHHGIISGVCIQVRE